MPIKRFGARYGTKPKKKFANIEKLQHQWHQCPSCRKQSVKRLALGIWQCRSCQSTFAGKAYVPYEK
ncbi:MAG: 50S ribosomal protein L37ae [Nanoarchaeota archaeon]|nr:50S ribosomal protein L37ae [Nanoarchaeota archaeon]